jgi:hypothetical protein
MRKLITRLRSINDPWEISQDKPSPFEPIVFEQTKLAPCRTPEDYIDFINGQVARGKPQQSYHRYDEFYTMFGHYTNAKVINGTVWVTFEPSDNGGKYWIWKSDEQTF